MKPAADVIEDDRACMNPVEGDAVVGCFIPHSELDKLRDENANLRHALAGVREILRILVNESQLAEDALDRIDATLKDA